jgi:hypothetical protein
MRWVEAERWEKIGEFPSASGMVAASPQGALFVVHGEAQVEQYKDGVWKSLGAPTHNLSQIANARVAVGPDDQPVVAYTGAGETKFVLIVAKLVKDLLTPYRIDEELRK